MLTERQAIEIFGALAQVTRLRIVRALVIAGPDGMSAGSLAGATDVSPSNLSFHLRELEGAGLVSSRREQRSIIYVCGYDTLAHMQTFLMENCCAASPCKGAGRPPGTAVGAPRKRTIKNGGR